MYQYCYKKSLTWLKRSKQAFRNCAQSEPLYSGLQIHLGRCMSRGTQVSVPPGKQGS